MKPMPMGKGRVRAEAILAWLPAGPVVGAEVGVHAGELSAMLLARPELQLYMVDSWAPFAFGDTDVTQEDQFCFMQEAYYATAFAGNRAKILWLDSATAAQLHGFPPLDFVFIDAEHTYEAVRSDIALWLPHIKPGGFIAGHDYNRATPGVIRAVNEAFGLVDLTGGDRTWRVRL